MASIDTQIDQITSTARTLLTDMAQRGVITFEGADLDRISARAVEYAVLELRGPARRSAVAERIGPVYTLPEVAGWLTGPAEDPLTSEAVRKRALKRQLVAFQSDDRQWLFPAYQFDAVAGRLVVRDDVVAVWRALPHGDWRSDATLAAWMNTRLHSMDALAPAAFAATHGADHPVVAAAVSRLRADAAA